MRGNNDGVSFMERRGGKEEEKKKINDNFVINIWVLK